MRRFLPGPRSLGRAFRSLTALALLPSFVAFSPASAVAQPWSWPERPENLQVLEGFDGARLRPVMAGFTRALGVRCNHCHVGEDGQPLSTFDFASDAHPNKDRAREMLRMLESINGHLEEIDPSGDERVNVWCHTCHRGRPRPMTLQEELAESYRTEGTEAALAHYDDLRARFFGRGAYDFGDEGLNALGHQVLQDGDSAAAVEIFRLNVEHHPGSANAWDGLGEAHAAIGDSDAAVAAYGRSLELNPRNRNARRKLEELGVSPD